MRIPSPTRSSTLAAAGLALLLAAGAARANAPAASPGAGAAAEATSRAPDASEKAAMLVVLGEEKDAGRTAWFAVAAGDAESKTTADALAAVFEEAGWKVESRTLTGMRLKPGVSMLLAEEQPPAWTESAQRAMQASGIEVKSATGYRPYFTEKKAEDPAWPGVPIDDDQAFVIVVGPAPAS